MNAQFKIGDRVIRKAFTNCFGKYVPAEEGLIVSRVRLIEPSSKSRHAIDPYYRVDTQDSNGYSVCEGAERFFIKA